MQFNFISAKRVYAEVKSRLDSYFSVGAMDDILFSVWLRPVLDKLGGTILKRSTAVVNIDNHQGILPEDFHSIYDVWVCESSRLKSIEDPSYIYYQDDYIFEDQCKQKCASCQANDKDNCTCPEEYPECKVIHKVTGKSVFSFKRQRRIVPGDLFTTDLCQQQCPVLRASSQDTFQISDCHIFTTLKEATLNIYYFKKNIDEHGIPMVPDNPYIQEYLKAFLVFKLYEKLLDDTHDETFNQVITKKNLAAKDLKDAYLNMEYNLKKPSKESIINSNEREKKRFNRLRRRYF